MFHYIFVVEQLQVCSGRGFSKGQQQDRIIGMHGSLKACRGADAIVFNLFACEGWFIAKYFDVPCVAASPFAVTRYYWYIAGSALRGYHLHSVWPSGTPFCHMIPSLFRPQNIESNPILQSKF